MAKLLSGSELVGYIQERQARQVRSLRQSSHVYPKLAIIKSNISSPVIDLYVRLKIQYATELGIETIVESLTDDQMPAAIARLNADQTIHGIIVQLPVSNPASTDAIIDVIAPTKDVDGLGEKAEYDSATATAITWLLAGYGVDLKGKNLVIIGSGRLVGGPLEKIWKRSGYAVRVLDDTTPDIGSEVFKGDVIVSATGVPRLIKSEMIQIGATVVDAGTANENGMIVGDVDQAVRERDDIKITPQKGGVGPLTIAALLDHVIQAATRIAEQNHADEK